MALGLLRGMDDVSEDMINKTIQCSKEIFQDYLYDRNHKKKFMAVLKI